MERRKKVNKTNKMYVVLTKNQYNELEIQNEFQDIDDAVAYADDNCKLQPQIVAKLEIIDEIWKSSLCTCAVQYAFGRIIWTSDKCNEHGGDFNNENEN